MAFGLLAKPRFTKDLWCLDSVLGCGLLKAQLLSSGRSLDFYRVTPNVHLGLYPRQ